MGDAGAIKHKLRPFNTTMTEDMSTYDRIKYIRDIDLCTNKMITLVTGNVLKYFTIDMGDPFELKGMDDLAAIKIKEYLAKERIRLGVVDDDLMEYPMEDEEPEDEEGILLEEFEPEPAAESVAPPKTTTAPTSRKRSKNFMQNFNSDEVDFSFLSSDQE